MEIKSIFDKFFFNISQIKNNKDFENIVFDIFNFQYNNNQVYNQWCKLNNTTTIRNINDIPFLPISFFKTHKVISFNDMNVEDYFLSSGTTNQQRSCHYIFSKQHYIKNTISCFEQFYNHIENYCYLCLLPNYLEQQHSSLICMMDYFVSKSHYNQSGFFKENISDVIDILQYNEQKEIPTILFGVTYALLDLIELHKFKLKHTIIFETGGMKGKREEISKTVLHNILKKGFGVDMIASEYGMCELFSQAYAKNNGKFQTPKQMKVIIKPINDPKGKNIINHNGIINIIDLANFATCSFIQTDDIGIQYDNGCFEVIGRKDNADLRGCNLMYV